MTVKAQKCQNNNEKVLIKMDPIRKICLDEILCNHILGKFEKKRLNRKLVEFLYKSFGIEDEIPSVNKEVYLWNVMISTQDNEIFTVERHYLTYLELESIENVSMGVPISRVNPLKIGGKK